MCVIMHMCVHIPMYFCVCVCAHAPMCLSILRENVTSCIQKKNTKIIRKQLKYVHIIATLSRDRKEG